MIKKDSRMDLLIQSVLDLGEDEFYRASRYHLPLVVALINSEDKRAFDILESSIRKTDILQQLTSEVILVFLTHTNYAEFEKFLKKIKKEFDFTYTASEFKGSEEGFIKGLFEENDTKVMVI